MNTIDTLTLKALQLKQSISGSGGFPSDIVDHIIEKNPEATKESMRNICAFISKELFAEVEQLCNNLSLSKRQLIEMALIDIIAKAHEVMTRHEVFDALDETQE
jgi:arsenate reductase-like glutaredoxin family protein